jgi:hypothetical protein
MGAVVVLAQLGLMVLLFRLFLLAAAAGLEQHRQYLVVQFNTQVVEVARH